MEQAQKHDDESKAYVGDLTELAYIDILANSKIRFDSVKRMTQIQNTS